MVRHDARMKNVLKTVGASIPGAIAGAIVWNVVNSSYQVNGQGILERQAWPLNNVYTWSTDRRLVSPPELMHDIEEVLALHRLATLPDRTASSVGLHAYSDATIYQGANPIRMRTVAASAFAGMLLAFALMIVLLRSYEGSQLWMDRTPLATVWHGDDRWICVHGNANCQDPKRSITTQSQSTGKLTHPARRIAGLL